MAASKRRMIDPDTWTDERFVELSPLARLLFIGMWNFCCDNGHIEDRPRQLKLRVLPGDDCDIDALVSELLEMGVVTRASGYLKVPNLPRRQSLDLRFLVFCDHCDDDPERHYQRTDKKATRRGNDVRTSDARVQHGSTPRKGDVDVDGDGDGLGRDKPAPRAARGTRIPDDFVVTDEMRQWAKDKGLDHLDLDGITEEFSDYWRSVPGAKGTKLDWPATWRNWIRRKADDHKVRPLPTRAATLPDVADIVRQRGF